MEAPARVKATERNVSTSQMVAGASIATHTQCFTKDSNKTLSDICIPLCIRQDLV